MPKTRFELSNIDKAWQSDFWVWKWIWKSVYSIQYIFSLIKSHQSANTKSLLSLSMCMTIIKWTEAFWTIEILIWQKNVHGHPVSFDTNVSKWQTHLDIFKIIKYSLIFEIHTIKYIIYLSSMEDEEKHRYLQLLGPTLIRGIRK